MNPLIRNTRRVLFGSRVASEDIMQRIRGTLSISPQLLLVRYNDYNPLTGRAAILAYVAVFAAWASVILSIGSVITSWQYYTDNDYVNVVFSLLDALVLSLLVGSGMWGMERTMDTSYSTEVSAVLHKTFPTMEMEQKTFAMVTIDCGDNIIGTILRRTHGGDAMYYNIPPLKRIN